ncbi:hypothetical protein SCHPADRAFT_644616 [Schizopora paradoxa]|uniref:Uncharacterized protein n=1 Tax=Schizopora paradoxa TaxID=27342 RepID=A0A0H2R6V9_9AGAM|nr:hypothetical protein SCHPADRAFT_644616 [Schizopora paradoxa]
MGHYTFLPQASPFFEIRHSSKPQRIGVKDRLPRSSSFQAHFSGTLAGPLTNLPNCGKPTIYPYSDLVLFDQPKVRGRPRLCRLRLTKILLRSLSNVIHPHCGDAQKEGGPGGLVLKGHRHLRPSPSLQCSDGITSRKSYLNRPPITSLVHCGETQRAMRRVTRFVQLSTEGAYRSADPPVPYVCKRRAGTSKIILRFVALP